ncbi:MAG TPA: AtzE family amidohydrolase, partial [Burkholderiaceae bacterium]|nr:AtzE family amidohydrolase [Burkholderiaceae bacterium]
MSELFSLSAASLAASIRNGEHTAVAVVHAALARIHALDQRYNCFTAVTRDRALAAAARIDGEIAAGRSVGPLAGVPFAVKNLFDVAGLPTLAGSKINRELTPAARDAALVTRLEQAGAVLIGALNMDEYAYGFTTENAHYGPTRNPHDVERVAGGSSGGSAAAVAAGFVPLTLGSDTNGSIRVPASLCGVFGLKPTYGRLSRSGAFLFAASLDHLGPFGRSTRDLALAYDAMQGADGDDPAQSPRPLEAAYQALAQGVEGLRIAVAGGYFHDFAAPEARATVAHAAQALRVTRHVTIPEAQRARAAAFVITMAEGGNLHLPNLKTRPLDFDFATRDRFLAGCLVPANYVVQAQRFR